MDESRLDVLLARYGGAVPRYTSYPPATRFDPDTGAAQSAGWLDAVAAETPISLYLHVPFCHEMCSFCGCNTSVVNSSSVRAAYGALLIEEISRVAGRLHGRGRVTALHWGGGTPTALPPSTFARVMREIERQFTFMPDAERAIELDPRHLPDDYPALLKTYRFTRASVGVQDLDPVVQQACGRLQPEVLTATCLARLRSEAGVASVNVDLMYGLPHQTMASVGATARRIAHYEPDRIAVFGYAHVPWKVRRQTLIDGQALPGTRARFEQRAEIDDVLRGAGYVAVGLDHYARPSDHLARTGGQTGAPGTRLHRNFQGYTTDDAPVLIGLGASAISLFPEGIVQNAATTQAYARALGRDAALPVQHGLARTEDDHRRWTVIERLMCDLAVDLRATTGVGWGAFGGARARLAGFERDGLVTIHDTHVQVTELGRPFLRAVAAVFDATLPAATEGPRHAVAV
ncbi:coproporphyrinogen III oxidase [Ameyamaea chiangmaiensis NBRC 103196]|uniref:Coproporphyrinogen-III oxidase n=1 Tax=Ameyamaea chiangmaiensis TaxID=442969 RepID=A0A850P8M2_9PROT|nr:oxygen-independent coproporphyrinogen III oxidase [Ameyamaea chiangmaiensis]MBS4075874.1 oxygen-independent coproporphyrinogen III oxidase [Ameyamaea chiangmaiensis]NVN40937.1 oxygen-independent coproporphyrinogen III oxidase [Ameyamaea chiangmaiensis]GBQ64057.1 coproporphyrinogen III oxidase [Ameyamaea chiangmaiensis NBRC 103196]